MKVLITGGTGFIGKNLVKTLVAKGYKVTCFVRKTSNIGVFKELDVKFSYGDISDKNSIEDALNDNEIIIHLAGLQSFSEYSKKLYSLIYQTNVLGLKNLLDAVTSKKPKSLKKVVFISSTAAVGLTNGKIDEGVLCNPISPYQKAKYEGEKLCLTYFEKYNLPIVILRPSMIYGTNGDHSQIQKMVGVIKKGFFPIIGNGRNNVPMIHINDAVEGIIRGALKGKPGNIYYITNREKTTMKELVDIISKKLGVKVFKVKIPVFAAYITAATVEFSYKLFGMNGSISRRRILSMSSERIFDVSKAEKELGFVSKVSAEEGISMALKEYEL